MSRHAATKHPETGNRGQGNSRNVSSTAATDWVRFAIGPVDRKFGPETGKLRLTGTPGTPGLREGDRVGHGLDLLIDPAVGAPPRQVRLYLLEFLEISEAIDWVLRETPADDGLTRLWEELRAERQHYGPTVVVDSVRATQLAIALRPLIADILMGLGVVLEVCPTSNWRIRGIASPLRHPVSWWASLGGHFLTGTDDPGVYPCTLRGEEFAVSCSVGSTRSGG